MEKFIDRIYKDKKPMIMGILNITPDSFSDGGRFNNIDNALEQTKRLINEGADIIDIGGESTRPGAKPVSLDEEIKRVIPIIREVKREFDVLVSVDTYKSKVAEEAIKVGADMINDVWAAQKDLNMAKVVSDYKKPIIIMHNNKDTFYDKDIIISMKEFFDKSIYLLESEGVRRKDIIIDPGIGFGKTTEQNLEVMNRLDELKSLDLPILLGTSRKSLIGNVLGLEVEDRLFGTLATNIYGAIKGVNIIRIHDVKEHFQSIKMLDAVINYKK